MPVTSSSYFYWGLESDRYPMMHGSFMAVYNSSTQFKQIREKSRSTTIKGSYHGRQWQYLDHYSIPMCPVYVSGHSHGVDINCYLPAQYQAILNLAGSSGRNKTKTTMRTTKWFHSHSKTAACYLTNSVISCFKPSMVRLGSLKRSRIVLLHFLMAICDEELDTVDTLKMHQFTCKFLPSFVFSSFTP